MVLKHHIIHQYFTFSKYLLNAPETEESSNALLIQLLMMQILFT